MKKTRFPNKLNTQRVLSKNSKRFTVTLVGVFLMIFALMGSEVSARVVQNLVEAPIPHMKNPDSNSEYQWYGYESYTKGYPKYNPFKIFYHDLRVNLNGSESYQVYCFNVKKSFPRTPNSIKQNWYKRIDGTAESFETHALNPRVHGEELTKKLRSVMYNGYPNDGNNIMEGIDPLNAIKVTQTAVWYYSDSSDFTVEQQWKSELASGDISDSQVHLMRKALAKLISSEYDSMVPEDYQLNIFVSEDQSYQNLLSASFVPTKPPTPEESPKPPIQTEKTSVLIRKYAIGNYSKLLEGATLQLTGDDTTGFQTIEFQSKGIGERVELLDGNYTLTELTPPDEYDIASPIKFRVKQGDVFITQENGDEIKNPNKEVLTPYSVEAYDDKEEVEPISGFTPYGKFYYAKNNKGTGKQVVYCFNADLHSPPESWDKGETIDPDRTTGQKVKYSHLAGTELWKYAKNPKESDPATFLKRIKKVIERGYGYNNNPTPEGLTDTKFRAATQLAIYYFTDSADLDTLKTYGKPEGEPDDLNRYGFHGFQFMDEKTLAFTRELVKEAEDSKESSIESLDFFVPNDSKYQSLIGTQYHSDDLVDVIRMEDKKKAAAPVTHSLIINKEVSGLAADYNALFEFSIKLKDSAKKNLVGSITTDKENPLSLENGIGKFTLKHGESITLKGLPSGYTYDIIEQNAQGYDVRINVNDGEQKLDTQITKHGVTTDQQVTFTNTKEGVVPTGLHNRLAVYVVMTLVSVGFFATWKLLGRFKN